MSVSDRFKQPTERVHEMLQTDFTYLRVIGWAWYHVSTVRADLSRFIVAYQLGPMMPTTDVTETLDEALALTGGKASVPAIVRCSRATTVRRTCRRTGGLFRGAGHDAYLRVPCHEPRDNCTPADVYYGRHHRVLSERDEIK